VTGLSKSLRAHGLVRDIELRSLNSNLPAADLSLRGELIELGGRPFIVSVIHDITDRVQAEEALARKPARALDPVEQICRVWSIVVRTMLTGRWNLSVKAAANSPATRRRNSWAIA